MPITDNTMIQIQLKVDISYILWHDKHYQVMVNSLTFTGKLIMSLFALSLSYQQLLMSAAELPECDKN
jgi:hypothetical protein